MPFLYCFVCVFFFKQKTAYEMRISDWSSDVCSSDLDGLLKALTKTVIETALDEEMTDHLGYDRHDPTGRNSGNSRNGTRTKTVLTDNCGPVEIEVPRDRNGSFDPTNVGRWQRRSGEVDTIVNRPGVSGDGSDERRGGNEG